jgi:hypothetical protein
LYDLSYNDAGDSPTREHQRNREASAQKCGGYVGDEASAEVQLSYHQAQRDVCCGVAGNCDGEASQDSNGIWTVEESGHRGGQHPGRDGHARADKELDGERCSGRLRNVSSAVGKGEIETKSWHSGDVHAQPGYREKAKVSGRQLMGNHDEDNALHARAEPTVQGKPQGAESGT